LDWARGKSSPFGGTKKPCPTQKSLDAIIAAHVSYTKFRQKFNALWGEMLVEYQKKKEKRTTLAVVSKDGNYKVKRVNK
jgi:tRNA 2-selenouridine synthase SelU